jgi:cyclopropane fatty-acyl-phospholipid synthase-like methyltransferase
MKDLVQRGYDACGSAYLRDFANQERLEIRRLIGLMPDAPRVLDVGCGVGEPVTRMLVEGGCNVTAVDFSREQIKIARENLPDVTFVHADVMAASLSFPGAFFDSIVACHVIQHIPRDHHAELFERLAGWLKPGGLLLCTVGLADLPGHVSAHYHGAAMFWNHFDLPTSQRLIEEAGLLILETIIDRRVSEPQPVILALKPKTDE